MNLSLYITKNCPTCAKVVESIRSGNYDCAIINVSEDQQEPPVPLFIFPALFRGNNLVAYGEKIIQSLDAQ